MLFGPRPQILVSNISKQQLQQEHKSNKFLFMSRKPKATSVRSLLNFIRSCCMAAVVVSIIRTHEKNFGTQPNSSCDVRPKCISIVVRPGGMNMPYTHTHKQTYLHTHVNVCCTGKPYDVVENCTCAHFSKGRSVGSLSGRLFVCLYASRSVLSNLAENL